MARDIDVTRIMYAFPSTRGSSAEWPELRARRRPEGGTLPYPSPPLLPPSELPPAFAAPRPVPTQTQAVTWTVTREPDVSAAFERPVLPDALDARLVILREPDSERARAYRLLRHRLLALHDPRVVAVTSARPGEGKTTCALNLALAMAEDSMTRVLLIDANLRRPALPDIIDAPQSSSLADALARSGPSGPRYCVVAVPGTRLHVAAVARAALEGARLDRAHLAVVLDDLRYVYDYVVIDTASVFESGDVDVVAECSRAVLMTARAGRSRKEDMRRAVEHLAPTPVLGSVLIDA